MLRRGSRWFYGHFVRLDRYYRGNSEAESGNRSNGTIFAQLETSEPTPPSRKAELIMTKRTILILSLIAASISAHAVAFTSVSPTLIEVEERIVLPFQFFTRDFELRDVDTPMAFAVPGYRRDEEIQLTSEL